MSKDIKRLKRELFRYLARTVPERGNACKAPEVEGRTVFQEQQEGRGGSSGLSEGTLTRQGQTMKEKGDAGPLGLYCSLS